MWKKVLLITVVFLSMLIGGFFWARASETLLFDIALWAVAVSMALGVLLGAIRAKLKGREEIENGAVVRHGGGAFLGHWGTALGIFVLIASAILLGFLFIPGQVETAKEALFPLNLHFIGVVITLFGGFYFVTDFVLSRNYSLLVPNLNDIIGGFFGKYLLRRKWRAETKYLSSQKSAFLAWAVLGAVMLITGAIKVAAHVWPIQASVLGITTFIHDIFSLLFILMLIVHVLLVIALPTHWPMLKSWLTGKVSEEYVREEHPIWYEELKKRS